MEVSAAVLGGRQYIIKSLFMLFDKLGFITSVRRKVEENKEQEDIKVYCSGR